MTRMVSFRLSDAEYKQIEKVCRATNARTISDVARMAVKSLVNNRDGDGNTDVRRKIQDLEQRISKLDEQVARLRGSQTEEIAS